MSKLKDYLLNEETNEFVIHLLTLLPEFIQGHYNPVDIINELSKYHGMSNEEVNTKLLNILFEILLGKCTQDLVGKHNDIDFNTLDKNEYEIGCRIEFEHTNDHFIAAAIARDHLSEISDYYTRLIEMERKAKEDGDKF